MNFAIDNLAVLVNQIISYRCCRHHRSVAVRGLERCDGDTPLLMPMRKLVHRTMVEFEFFNAINHLNKPTV